MKIFFFALLMFSWCNTLSSQKASPAGTEKGASPISSPLGGGLEGTTYAVVVGISDYQDEGIPDLRFADKDAEAFANFLHSPAGGSLNGDHLKLLTNEEATNGNIVAALYWLLEVSKEGDHAIIYFSGHGDVEKKTLTQPGYLLCWDAPAQVYMMGGAINLRDVQEIISTLSVQNKAKVVVITDACRSGKLSGSAINGTQLTSANLAQQAANEIKILSCQPDEYSIEGEQWGGGRGAFSFNLVDALYGMADANNDLSVDLKEVGRYLEDHVNAEVTPVSQNPKVVGNPTERMSTVDAKLLAALRSGKTSQMLMLSPIASRGLEDDVLAGVDTTTRELYRLFKKALEDKVFLSPATACADAYYESLMAEPQLARLHPTMTRNYAAALQDDAQQVLNRWLKMDIKELQLSKITKAAKYEPYPHYLERATELLGPQHFMYPLLQARKYFFEGYLLALSTSYHDKELGERALGKFREALHWQPGMPQAYLSMGGVFARDMGQTDSLEHYARLATAQAPSWVIPFTHTAYLLIMGYSNYDRAHAFLELANQIDSNSIITLYHWGLYYYFKGKVSREKASPLFQKAAYYYKKTIQLDSTMIRSYDGLGAVYAEIGSPEESEQAYKKIIALDSTEASPYNNLGMLYKDIVHRYAEADWAFKKSIEMDSTMIQPYRNLGWLYGYNLHDWAAAEPFFKKAIELYPGDQPSMNMLGTIYQHTNQLASAAEHYKKYIASDSSWVEGYVALGSLYAKTGRQAEAEPLFKRAIELGPTFLPAYYSLGNFYRKAGRIEEAEQYLKKAIQIDPNATGAYISLGAFYQRTNRPEAAVLQYQKAIEIDSNYVYAYLLLGNLYDETGHHSAATQQYQKATKLDAEFMFDYTEWPVLIHPYFYHESSWKTKVRQMPNAITFWPSASNYAILGNTYTHLGRMKEAEAAFQKALEIDPDYPNTYLFLAQWALKNNQSEQDWQYLEESLEKGFDEWLYLEMVPDFIDWRKEARWGELMKKYFPD